MKLFNQRTNLIKTIFCLSIFVAFSILSVSCKDNDDKYVKPELVINTQLKGDYIMFAKDGGSHELTFTTSRPWTVTSSADWIAVDPSSGKAGSVKVVVKALANMGVARTASITISSGVTKKSITIKQNGAAGSDANIVIFNEMFADGLGCWTTKKLEKEGYDWAAGKFLDKNTKEVKETYAKISAYNSTTKKGVPTKSILVSPMVDFKTATVFSFKYKSYFAVSGTMLKVVLLNNNKEVIGDALETVDTDQPSKGFAKDWVTITVAIPLTDNAKYVGLLYEADETHTTGFEVTDLKLLGGEGSTKADCGNGSSDPVVTPPTSSDAISSFSVDFSDGNMPKDWTTESKTDSRVWQIKDYEGKHFAQMSGYKSTKNETAYLTTPLLDLSKASTLTFNSKVRYPVAGTILKVVLLDANKQITNTLKSYDLDTEHEFELQTIDIPADDNSKYIAFIYEGDPTHTSQIQLTDITLNAKDGSTVSPVVPDPNPAPNPNPTPNPSMDKDLFFVAYAEGSSNNKYLSIYNPNDKEIDLSSYSLKLNQFNSKNGFYKDIEEHLTGTIPANGVIVYKNSGAKTYTGEAISLNSILVFNGNDNIALLKGGNIIDVIGSWGDAWISDDKPKGIGADITLHRKASIDSPSATFDISQWEEFPKDSAEPLGKR